MACLDTQCPGCCVGRPVTLWLEVAAVARARPLSTVDGALRCSCGVLLLKEPNRDCHANEGDELVGAVDRGEPSRFLLESVVLHQG